jgi:pilus assembly protein Flp/PilA
MLKFYIKASEALKSLRADAAGVVSFEYILVAACVVAAVVAAFGTDATSGIGKALTDGLKTITDQIPS